MWTVNTFYCREITTLIIKSCPDMLGEFTYSMDYVSCYLSNVKKISQEFIYYRDTGLCFDSASWFPFLRNLPVIALPRFSTTFHRVFFNIPRCSWVPQYLGIRCHQPLAELYLELSTKPCSWSPFSLAWKSGEEVPFSWLLLTLGRSTQ